MPYIREDMAAITLQVDGKTYPAPGVSWAEIEGGNLEADDGKTRPGGMGYEVSVGGPRSREDVTLRMPFDDIVAGLHKELEGLVGRGAATVGWQFLGADRLPIGKTHTITGTLKSVAIPDFETGSGEVGMYEAVVSCNELAS